MVSVSSAVPKLPDGNIDIAQWSQRLVQGHARLQHEPLEEAATWLSGFGDSLLLQSLELAEMVARGQLANDSFYWLLLIIEHRYPTLDMALFDYVEQVAYVSGPHDDLSLVVPLCLEAIKQRKFFIFIKVIEDIHSVEESDFSCPFLYDRFNDDLLEDVTVKDPDLAV